MTGCLKKLQPQGWIQGRSMD